VKEDEDSSGNTDHAVLGSEMAVPILQELDFPEEKIKHIQDCIISHRYRTGNAPKTKEAKILFDADKLDISGAIGIARAFVWVGKNNANIYKKVNLDEYTNDNMGGKLNGRIKDKTKHSPQIEFETKLKFLANNLQTQKAKEIFKERLQFCESFLNRLEKEVKGEM
ncbi:MAG: phosphohydrolase, partial [Patescibacteria group bacterium]|nr:phosphohydrolase [Patescibacteria group bacterium]